MPKSNQRNLTLSNLFSFNGYTALVLQFHLLVVLPAYLITNTPVQSFLIVFHLGHFRFKQRIILLRIAAIGVIPLGIYGVNN